MKRIIQTMFNKNGELTEAEEGMTPAQMERYVKAERAIERGSFKRAVCPFCLYIGTKDKFMFKNQDYSLSKMFRCPRCRNQMREKTTQLFDKGPNEYSEWFWDQIYFYGNYERMDFDSVIETMEELGFEDVFWDWWERKKAEKEKAKSSSLEA